MSTRTCCYIVASYKLAMAAAAQRPAATAQITNIFGKENCVLEQHVFKQIHCIVLVHPLQRQRQLQLGGCQWDGRMGGCAAEGVGGAALGAAGSTAGGAPAASRAARGGAPEGAPAGAGAGE